MIFPKHLLLCLLWGLPSLAGAQSDSTVQDSVRPRKWGILPVPAIASSPETGWYIGAVALITYNPRLGDGTRTSNGKLEFNYTQNKQWIFDNNWNIFTRENKYNLQGELQWMLFPENFWGIGRVLHFLHSLEIEFLMGVGAEASLEEVHDARSTLLFKNYL